MEKKVTILVPVYGVEKYIAECAESLFKQTYRNIRYVFCDDCTPDSSIEKLKGVLSAYPNRADAVCIIRNDSNLGVGGTRANLVKHIESEFFMIVDSDDTLPPEAVERLVAKMDLCQADVVVGAYAQFSSRGIDKIYKPEVCSDRHFRKLVYSRLSNEFHVWGKMYRTSVLEKTGPVFFQGINSAEDMCATSIICSVAHRETVDDVVYNYRVDNNSTFSRLSPQVNFISFLKASKKVLDFFERKGSVPIAVELGALYCYRRGRRQSVNIDDINSTLNFVPSHLSTKVIFRLLQSTNGLISGFGVVLFAVFRRFIISL